MLDRYVVEMSDVSPRSHNYQYNLSFRILHLINAYSHCEKAFIRCNGINRQTLRYHHNVVTLCVDFIWMYRQIQHYYTESNLNVRLVKYNQLSNSLVTCSSSKLLPKILNRSFKNYCMTTSKNVFSVLNANLINNSFT